ncbi:MAG TPA: polysaccharide deacetylase family protein [Polyangiaceae bacterium]
MPPARFSFYLLNFAVIGLALRSALAGPPPWTWTLFASCLYVACFMCGVLFLRLRIFVDAVLRGPAGAEGVALTFDDGPDPVWTRRTLDALDAAGKKGTFFVIGKKAETHPEVITEILARGHAVGLHSYGHDRLFAMRGPGTWRRDLKRGIRVLEKLTGQRPALFRPPIGHTNPHVARVLRELGLRVIGWDVGARDGVAADPGDVAARVLAGATNGSIILLHDAAERGDREPAGVLALPAILEGLEARKLEVVPLTRFLA